MKIYGKNLKVKEDIKIFVRLCDLDLNQISEESGKLFKTFEQKKEL